MYRLSDIDLSQNNFQENNTQEKYKNLVLNVIETDKEKITDEVIELYLKYIRGFSTLNLSFSNITSQSLKVLSEKNPEYLVELNLSHCNKIFTLKDIHLFTKLEVLNLRHCSGFKLKNETLVYIRNCTALKELILDYCYITDDILFLLGTLRNIRKISLVGCIYISDYGVERLTKFNTLEEIDLSETSITDKAIFYLSEMTRTRKVKIILDKCMKINTSELTNRLVCKL